MIGKIIIIILIVSLGTLFFFYLRGLKKKLDDVIAVFPKGFSGRIVEIESEIKFSKLMLTSIVERLAESRNRDVFLHQDFLLEKFLGRLRNELNDALDHPSETILDPKSPAEIERMAKRKKSTELQNKTKAENKKLQKGPEQETALKSIQRRLQKAKKLELPANTESIAKKTSRNTK